MALQAIPGYDLQPSAKQVVSTTNYITDFNFLNQYLPDIYDQDFARYGNRSVSSFLRMVSAELPSDSDLIKWSEEGRLHIKYEQVGTAAVATAANSIILQVNDTLTPNRANIGLTAGTIAIRAKQTVMLSFNNGAGYNKAIVESVDLAQNRFTVAVYEQGGLVANGTGLGSSDITVFIYGSEFAKGTDGMEGSLEADSNIFDNSPIIMKENYQVSGSDMAQVGWVELPPEMGGGYLWYLKSQHETRLRFEDYMETTAIEAVPMENSSNTAIAKGSEGVFYTVGTRGNLFQGYPETLSEWDTIVGRLDKQGSIEENVIFNNREMSFSINDFLAAQNSNGPGGTSYGMFPNGEQMAINLGFEGFRRGYDFYKTDWKYLNDPTMRGGLKSGKVNGLLVPAGTTNVYDEVMGSTVKRPFLHVRYRMVNGEDRKYKTWATGSAGGAATNNTDELRVNMLTERCICTLGPNNFMLFED